MHLKLVTFLQEEKRILKWPRVSKDMISQKGKVDSKSKTETYSYICEMSGFGNPKTQRKHLTMTILNYLLLYQLVNQDWLYFRKS